MAALRSEAAGVALDLLNPDTFGDGQPHAVYDALRAEAPVWRHPGSALQAPFHVLTRYDDIRAVSLDARNFTSTRGFTVRTDNRASMDPEIARTLGRFMLSMDNPEHDRFRSIVAKAFLPAAISRVEPRIRASVDQMLQDLDGRDEVEFVTEVGAAVPIKTICAIMGVPPEDEWRVFEFTNAVFGADDPDYAPSREVANERYLAIFDYGLHLLSRRRQEPQEDLLTLIAHGDVDGRPLDETEQKSFFSNTIAAGNETTRSSLSGALWALSRHPDEQAKLAADPGLIVGAVHELLRWFSPVVQMARTATTDVEVGGTMVRAGEVVAMLYGAGNRDPAMFENPHRLQVDRANANRHLTFGYGLHHCLGVRLAIVQMRIMLEALIGRYPRFRVLAEPRYVRSNFVMAMKALPLRLNG